MHGILAALLMIPLVATLSEPAPAQPYPTKPIKLIVPFGAGGPVDVMARLIAQKLSVSVGAVVVENKPGQGGTLGARIVATAEPDGYTLMMATSTTMGVSANLYKNLDFDPVKSFAPVALVSSVPMVLVVRPTLPINSTQELIAYAKANPGKLNFGFPTGALPHLTGALFKMRTGTDFAFIPYKAANNVVTDLVAGQIDFTFEPASVLLGQISDKKVRPLGVASLNRLTQIPQVPTLDESDVKNFVSVSWSGVVAPVGAPKPIIDKLNVAINTELKSPEMIERLLRLGAEIRAGTPEDFDKFITEEGPKWAEVIKSSGLKLEP
ncbi:Bug family tripartite tricarboxylate transporter substrate binding protein [Rhodoplanes sp. Z2-YC6860]|uniref:Bug family tripartite tricarboxylate transporter substrate binding protein n=1 Tax=Rhodoplanes sp. Z2-YC6860 TaxID=674703 RepID=UPI00078C0A63|nr:tripartite tricarboxylate transporter substrate binding protein [Rhodoplanes sp. Z2-YC6860]AMN41935.1 extra-cytoplasmic solute receptor [Rhodoplanes sp. Z2-YC6860]